MNTDHSKKSMNSARRQSTLQTSRWIAGVSGVLFLLLIVLVKTVDTATVEATGKTMGLYTLNGGFHALTGVNMFWYKLTQALGIFLILVAGGFAFLGLHQLIKRKSLLKVDRCLLCLGGLYAVLIVLYAFFEKVIINYRPIIMDGKLAAEASFPSSHTMLVCVVMGSAVMLIPHYVKDAKIRQILQIVCLLVILITVIGRLICGVHWFTDILGGVLISMTLLALFRIVSMKRGNR